MTILHRFGEFLRETLSTVPLSWVRALFVGTLVVLLVWVIRLPQNVTSPDGSTNRWDENLKTGAVFALVLQIVIYLLL